MQFIADSIDISGTVFNKRCLAHVREENGRFHGLARDSGIDAYQFRLAYGLFYR